LYSNEETHGHSGTDAPVQFEMINNSLAAAAEQPRQISHKDANASALKDGSKRLASRRSRNSTGKEISMDDLRCQICSTVLGRKKDVQRHMKIHQKGKGYQCDRCPRHYNRLDNLQRHQSARHGRPGKGGQLACDYTGCNTGIP
jgi:uncharacterized Zn-finger protein